MFRVGSASRVSSLPSWVAGDTFPTHVAGSYSIQLLSHMLSVLCLSN